MANDAERIAIRQSMQRFSFDKFDKAKESWDDYIFAFEQMCRAKGLGEAGADYLNARRTLLLACVGSEPLKIVRNHFRPNDVNAQGYEEVKNAFRNYYKPKVTVFSARLDFMKRNRVDGETFGQYANVLRELADAAEYGANVMDFLLRDRFAAGLRHEKVEIELRQKWPDGREGNQEVTFETVVRLAESIERAENECTKGRSDDTSIKKASTRPKHLDGAGRSRYGSTGQPSDTAGACSRCGGKKHRDENDCRAKDATCHECGKSGHYARMCKSVGKKKGEKKKRRDKLKLVREESSDSDESESAESDDSYGQASAYKAIREVEVRTEKAVVRTRINGRKLTMDFDTGALQSTVGKETWKAIGAPKLRPTKPLTLYGGGPVETLGETTVDVEAFGELRILKLVVVNVKDVPLFGYDWARAFKMEINGVEIKRIKTDLSQNKASGRCPKSEQVPTGRCPKSEQAPTGAKVPTVPAAATVSKEAKMLMDEFRPLFSGEGGLIRGYQAVIRLREGAQPKRFRARPVPFALRKRIEQELERLVKEDILEKIDPSTTAVDYASPTVNVEKKNGGVRICGDFKVTINSDMIIDEHPMPTFEEITSKLNGGKKFSVIDLKDAYLQLQVAEESRKYLVIATHLGYFRYKRCPFGIASAPAIFQYTMDQILQGLPGTADFLDDIIVTGDNDEDHIKNLRAVFDRLQRAGLRTQADKCKLLQDSVVYLGHRIDASGVHPTEEKIIAIRDQPAPTNVSQLRSFCGLVNYYAKFIPCLQAICAPWYRLLEKGAKWEWTKDDDLIFRKVKNCLTADATLAHYDEKLPLIVACDACEYGLGAALLHRYPDGTERPIAFVSRTLKSSERQYAPIDREALALVFGVTRFYQYTYGRRFILATDHKPLQHIFGEAKELPKTAANRLARWAILLSGYSYSIEYRPGKDNAVADALSRLPLPQMEKSAAEAEISSDIRAVQSQKLDDLPVNSKELKKNTATDPRLSKVLNYMSVGWPEKKNVAADLVSFYEKREELSISHGIVIWHGRVIIPTACQQRVLEMLHAGHLGIVATRALARHYVWWPKIDEEIEHFVKRCGSCQQTRNWPAEVPLYSWNVPDGPWERVHIDFAGPLNGRMLFILIDAYSKWVEVKTMKSATTKKVTNALTDWFSRFGLPLQIVSDNGSQFTSAEFELFCKQRNITHIRTTPYHPKTNGLAERFVQTLKHRLSAIEDGPLEERLQTVLFTYRNTPQKTTGETPAKLLLNRNLNTVLDQLKPNPRRRMHDGIAKQKLDHDSKAAEREFVPGAAVWVQNERTTGCTEGSVQRQTGTHSYEIAVEGEVKRKHADQLRERLPEIQAPSEPLADVNPQPVLEAASSSVPAEPTAPPLRRSERQRKPVSLPYDEYLKSVRNRKKKPISKTKKW